MENCTVSDLKNMEFDRHIKPLKFIYGGSEIRVSTWTELCWAFVSWLIQQEYLNKAKLPVPNHANEGKYFINSEPCHEDLEKNASWLRIGDFYVDTKYNARAHIENIIFTLRYLGVFNPNFRITFKRH